MRVFGVNQLFILRGDEGQIKVITAKNTDDFLIAGSPPAIETLFEVMKQRFDVGKALLSDNLKFNGC